MSGKNSYSVSRFHLAKRSTLNNIDRKIVVKFALVSLAWYRNKLAWQNALHYKVQLAKLPNISNARDCFIQTPLNNYSDKNNFDKNTPQRSIFIKIRGVWIADETLSRQNLCHFIKNGYRNPGIETSFTVVIFCFHLVNYYDLRRNNLVLNQSRDGNSCSTNLLVYKSRL